MALTSACQRDETNGLSINDRIVLRIEEDRPATTRSIDDGLEIPFEINGRALSLSFNEPEEESLSDNATTRGAALDNTTNPIREIMVTALRDNGELYFKDAVVSISDNHGISQLFWPQEPLSFFASTASKEGVSLNPTYTRSGERCEGAFDYSLPDADLASPKRDATAQPDLLFAITPDRSLSTSSEVHLTFHHALSAVLFKVGTMPDGVRLKSISLGGLYGSGHCEMVDLGNEELQFSWSYSGRSQTATYTEEFDQEAVSGELMGSAETIFMMLPQTMGNQTMLRLGFTMDGVDYTFEKLLKEIIPAWEPDKKYIFTIGLPDKIDVEIDDQVEGNLKHEVTITNTGVATGYVRAAIVGYWRNAMGEVSEAWSTSDGEFSYAANWSTYWRRGSDGFYYYQLPLAHGHETECRLFESYTLYDAVSNAHVGQTLEIDLAVQIIPIASKSLWSELDNIH
mgnify:CR=1 FL=1